MPLSVAEIVAQSVELSGAQGYTGNFRELGGGEINETFLLDCGEHSLILRIARYADQQSLHREAVALEQLTLDRVPQLVFFNPESRIDGRVWILETHVPGKTVERLNVAQFRSLGELLAQVHAVRTEQVGVDAWQFFLDGCRTFGDENALLNHPNARLRALITRTQSYVQANQSLLNAVVLALRHGDATPGNVLVDGDMASLIDWELSSFADPMSEFSTIYYDDMEYNRGKWRVHITPEERAALFEGYEAAGGTIDEARVQMWMTIDKIGAAVFLYWRIHESGRLADNEQLAQYRLDLENLVQSLERTLH